jgi:hypothetical protein
MGRPSAREILAEQLDALGDRPLTLDEIEELVGSVRQDSPRQEAGLLSQGEPRWCFSTC